MKVSGNFKLKLGQQDTWDALTDIDVLQKAIPGVESIEEVGPDEYKAQMTVGIGIVRGRFSGRVKLSDFDEPRSYRMAVTGDGPGGWIKGSGVLSLEEDAPGVTKVSVDGDTQVGGLLARVGQRMIGNASNTLMKQFFAGIEKAASSRA